MLQQAEETSRALAAHKEEHTAYQRKDRKVVAGGMVPSSRNRNAMAAQQSSEVAVVHRACEDAEAGPLRPSQSSSSYPGCSLERMGSVAAVHEVQMDSVAEDIQKDPVAYVPVPDEAARMDRRMELVLQLSCSVDILPAHACISAVVDIDCEA